MGLMRTKRGCEIMRDFSKAFSEISFFFFLIEHIDDNSEESETVFVIIKIARKKPLSGANINVA